MGIDTFIRCQYFFHLPSIKGSALKGKDLLPRPRGRGAERGSKFFPFRVDPFSEGRQNSFDKVASFESVSVHNMFT